LQRRRRSTALPPALLASPQHRVTALPPAI
jgi:hypothetical protein